MGKKEKKIVEILFVVANLIVASCLLITYLKGLIIFEILTASLFLVALFSAFIVYEYSIHRKIKALANDLKFEFITRFLEQPRMEGIYRKNWFQIHFSSRDHGEYWGMPRTYIKLQYKDDKNFDTGKISKYTRYSLDGMQINGIEHIQRSYKNYLLMRVKDHIRDRPRLSALMDLLLKVAEESEIKRKK